MSRTCDVLEDCHAVRRFVHAGGVAVADVADRPGSVPGCLPPAWNMPMMDGMAFPRAPREEFGQHSPSVAFRTTENDIGQIEAAISNGAGKHVMKRYDEDNRTGEFAQVGLL